MKISNLKKINHYDLKKKLKDEYLKGGEINHRVDQFLIDICDNGLYSVSYNKNKPRLRITFPLFLCAIILVFITGCFKWLLTGTMYFDVKNYFIKKIIAWDKYCRFRIL